MTKKKKKTAKIESKKTLWIILKWHGIQFFEIRSLTQQTTFYMIQK